MKLVIHRLVHINRETINRLFDPMNVHDTSSSVRQSQNAVMLFVLIVFLLVSIGCSAAVTLTLDEYLHFQYGTKVLNGDSTCFDDSKMPVSVLNALPSGLASQLPDGLWKIALERFAVARLVTILISMLVACLIFSWSRSLPCTDSSLRSFHSYFTFSTRTSSLIPSS